MYVAMLAEVFVYYKYFCSDTRYASYEVLWPFAQCSFDYTPLKVNRNMAKKLLNAEKSLNTCGQRRTVYSLSGR